MYIYVSSSLKRYRWINRISGNKVNDDETCSQWTFVEFCFQLKQNTNNALCFIVFVELKSWESFVFLGVTALSILLSAGKDKGILPTRILRQLPRAMQYFVVFILLVPRYSENLQKWTCMPSKKRKKKVLFSACFNFVLFLGFPFSPADPGDD